MRPSDLMLDFGHPVAYYPGLVKSMGSPHAVIFFSQIFYWQDKTRSEIGVHKTREAIEGETGLTFEQQATARKQLVSRGVLIETHKRLEHKVYFRIDCDRLDEIVSENNVISRNRESRFREEGNTDLGKEVIPSSRTRETPRRGSGKADFDHTEITTEITTENTNTLAPSGDDAPAKRIKNDYSAEFETAWANYPKREGSNSKPAAFKCWNARIKEGVASEVLLAGVERYAKFCQAKGQTNTAYVMQATRFFGPGCEYENTWSAMAPQLASNHKQNTHAGFANRDYGATTAPFMARFNK